MMTTMAAVASSSLNPDAPLFIPAAYRQVEDFSPEWWELVKTTAWFRDHWFRQQQLHDAAPLALAAASFDYSIPADDFDVAALLPDDSVDLLLDTDDLFYTPDVHHHHHKPALLPGYDLDVLRALSLSTPRPVGAVVGVSSTSPRATQHQHHHQQQRHADKPAHLAGARAPARRAIQQPR